MKPLWADVFGNPSSITQEGLLAKKSLDAARLKVATIFGVTPRSIVFTSGGTESNNLAITGILSQHPRGHVIASRIEHPSVKEPIRAWELAGGSVTWLSADESGAIDPKHVREALRPDTVLVTLMWANNETGVWQPVREVFRAVKTARQKGSVYPIMHVDACQGPGYAPLKSLPDMGVDLVSISAQKFYGPKGIGVLYVRKGTPLAPLVRGGGHEDGLRAGTENVPLAVGVAESLSRAEETIQQGEHVGELRDLLESKLLALQGVERNGMGDRVPNISNLSFRGVLGELIVIELDALGIATSTGAACGTKDADPSAVLLAMGVSKEKALEAVRFSFMKNVRKSDIERIAAALPEILARQLRAK